MIRDEFEDEELATDPSTRKKATDWLMQVISARKPINLHLNGSPYEEDGESAVAVAEPLERPMPVKWAGEFGAEDLCGAPAVPVIKVEPVALTGKSEVTADDVCWVPEDRRLKPEPPPPPAVEPAPKVLQMSAARESQREPEVLRPEPRKPSPAAIAEEFYGKTNLAADPASRRSPDEVAIEDISREPAPYVVEPMPSWGAFSESFHASDILDRPITEADIARDWVVQSIEPTEVSGKDGVVLPFSFKVLKSRDAAPAESAADAPAQLDASLAPVAEASQVGTAAAVEEIQEAGVTATEEPLAPPELPSLTIAAELESASVAGPEGAASVAEEAPIAAKPVAPGIEAAVEVAPSPVGEPEQQPVESAASEPQTEETSPVPEAAASEAILEPVAPESETAHQPESVFAREGFWNGSVPGEVAASAEARQNGDMKPPYPTAAQGENIDESSNPPEEWVSAWKALLRIGSVLPWMAKTLPAGETGLAADAGAPAEVRQDVAGLRLVQYEIRTTVQDHTLQLKRMDEQLGRIRESLESKSSGSDLVENVESMSKLVRIVGAGLGGLVLVLILLVAILLAHGR
ncbi:MAG TPA: hypothetical protein VFL96_15145 [Acidobacteriaceae bacterium]|nr:hypothetical protein [Acidobacteriaceae bacterium]